MPVHVCEGICLSVQMPTKAGKVLWMLWRAGVASTCEPPNMELESSITTVNCWAISLTFCFLSLNQIVFGCNNCPEVYFFLFIVSRCQAYN